MQKSTLGAFENEHLPLIDNVRKANEINTFTLWLKKINMYTSRKYTGRTSHYNPKAPKFSWWGCIFSLIFVVIPFLALLIYFIIDYFR